VSPCHLEEWSLTKVLAIAVFVSVVFQFNYYTDDKRSKEKRDG